jgi:hypothetical protein
MAKGRSLRGFFSHCERSEAILQRSIVIASEAKQSYIDVYIIVRSPRLAVGKARDDEKNGHCERSKAILY